MRLTQAPSSSLFFWVLIGLLLNSFFITSSALPEDSPISQLQAIDTPAAASHLWVRHGLPHLTFFKPTIDSVKSAGLSVWMQNNMQRIHEENPHLKDQNITAPQIFAEYMVGEMNVDCLIQKESCDWKITPKTVIEHVDKLHPDWGPERRIEEARVTYFALHFMNMFTEIMHWNFHMFSQVQLNEHGLSGSVVKYFTIQNDMKSEQECELKKAMLQWGMGMAENLMCFGFGFIVPAGGLAKPLQSAITSASNIAQSGVQGLQAVIIREVELGEAKGQDKWSNATDTSTVELRMDITYTDGLCGGVGGGRKDENQDRQASMDAYIFHLFQDLRTSLEENFNTIMQGRWDDNGVYQSNIARYMDSSRAFELHARIKHNYTQYEDAMSQHFAQSLESSALVNDKCYLKCVDNDTMPSETRNSICKAEGWPNRNTRFCPEDHEHRICQIECWTIQMKGNHLKGPPGERELRTWHNLTIHNIAHASYLKFLNHGNKYSTPDEGVNQTSVFELDTRFTGKIPPFALPVSISKYGRITDYDDILDVNLNLARMDSNQAFPCQSGGWKSEDQAEFMRRLGWSPDSKDTTNGRNRELLEVICPLKILNNTPAAHWFALCGLGIQFPTKSHNLPGTKVASFEYKIEYGPHPNCSALREEVQGLSEMQGNFLFCAREDGGSKLAKQILKEEKDFRGIGPEPLPWTGANHRTRCDKWFRKNKEKLKNVKTVDDLK